MLPCLWLSYFPYSSIFLLYFSSNTCGIVSKSVSVLVCVNRSFRDIFCLLGGLLENIQNTCPWPSICIQELRKQHSSSEAQFQHSTDNSTGGQRPWNWCSEQQSKSHFFLHFKENGYKLFGITLWKTINVVWRVRLTICKCRYMKTRHIGQG